MRSAHTIDVVLGSDEHQFVGVVAVIASAVLNAARPEAIFLHVVTGPGESGALLALLRGAFPRPSFRYEIREFRPKPALERYIRAAAGGVCNVPHRSAAINCSRFYLCDLFPELDKVVYLDVDVIVQADLAQLFREATLEEHELAAVAMTFWGFQRESVHFRDVDFSQPGFNSGVFVTRLARWREEDVVPRIEYLMELWSNVREQLRDDLFYFGSQAIMNLVFHRRIQWLSRKWNLYGLGYDDNIAESDLRSAGILHWTGSRKPWTPQGLYKEYWKAQLSALDAGGAELRGAGELPGSGP